MMENLPSNLPRGGRMNHPLTGHSCRVGDTVRLKSGGPEMTIVELLPDGGVIAAWWPVESAGPKFASQPFQSPFTPQALALSDGAKLERLIDSMSAKDADGNTLAKAALEALNGALIAIAEATRAANRMPVKS